MKRREHYENLTPEEQDRKTGWWWKRLNEFMAGGRGVKDPLDVQIKRLHTAADEYREYEEVRQPFRSYRYLDVIFRVGVLLAILKGIEYAIDENNKDTIPGQIHAKIVELELWVRDMFYKYSAFEEPPQRIVFPPSTLSKKYTLIMDFDTLAFVDYEKDKKGMYMYKRAGLEYFLHTLLKDFELVLHTSYAYGGDYAALLKLDPTGLVFDWIRASGSGVRENEFGHFTADFKMLNRDPSKVIFLDFFKYKHANVITLPHINPRSPDAILPLLAIYLRDCVAGKNVEDVRPYVEVLQDPDKLEQTLKEYVRKLPVVNPHLADLATPEPDEEPEQGTIGKHEARIEKEVTWDDWDEQTPSDVSNSPWYMRAFGL